LETLTKATEGLKRRFTIEKINNSTELDQAAEKLNSVILATYDSPTATILKKLNPILFEK
jgi:hypothetical protein